MPDWMAVLGIDIVSDIVIDNRTNARIHNQDRSQRIKP